MMCAQQSVLGSLWFTTGEAQEMSDLAGSGVVDLSVLEHHVFRLRRTKPTTRARRPDTASSLHVIAAPEHATTS